MLRIFVEKYKNMSDDELVKLSRQEDSEAAVALLKRHMQLIKSRASYFYNGSIEMDDLVQEAIISFYLGLRNYNSELSAFTTFARTVVDRGIISVVRAAARKKQIPHDMLVSIEEDGFKDDDSPEDILIRAESVNALKDNIKQRLSRQEYKVFLLYTIAIILCFALMSRKIRQISLPDFQIIDIPCYSKAPEAAYRPAPAFWEACRRPYSG